MGGDGDDTLEGTDAAETVSDGAGAYTIFGGNGSDEFGLNQGDG